MVQKRLEKIFLYIGDMHIYDKEACYRKEVEFCGSDTSSRVTTNDQNVEMFSIFVLKKKVLKKIVFLIIVPIKKADNTRENK